MKIINKNEKLTQTNNTIEKLYKNGFIFNEIYIGDLNKCACGCNGKYVPAATSKEINKFLNLKKQRILQRYYNNNEFKTGKLTANGIYNISGYDEINIEITFQDEISIDRFGNGKVKGYRLYMRR